MPTWPVAEYTLAGIAMVAIAFVAMTLIKERKAPEKPKDERKSADMAQVVLNNTQAMREVGQAVSDLKEYLLTCTTRQETKIDEVLAHVRRGSKAG